MSGPVRGLIALGLLASAPFLLERRVVSGPEVLQDLVFLDGFDQVLVAILRYLFRLIYALLLFLNLLVQIADILVGRLKVARVELALLIRPETIRLPLLMILQIREFAFLDVLRALRLTESLLLQVFVAFPGLPDRVETPREALSQCGFLSCPTPAGARSVRTTRSLLDCFCHPVMILPRGSFLFLAAVQGVE